MNHAKIRVREEDLLKLVLDFLTARNLNVSMRTLEKESGVVNCPFTEDILFLRELILDGDWDEVLLFAQPFEGLREFDSKKFKYLILKQKFLELLSLKSHIVGKQAANSIEDVMKTLNVLEENCPTKEEYSNLCWLLTVPNLSERNEFKDWTLDNSRLKCFTAILDVVSKVPTLHKKSKQNKSIASKDRLLQLVVKGLFYESCIDYCQSKATGTNADVSSSLSVRTNVLQGIADDYSANLLSWVRSLGNDVFNQPFEQVSVEIVLERFARFDKGLRHSVDIPKKSNKGDDGGDDENIIFRSLNSLDPAVINRRKPKAATSKQSPLVKGIFPKDEQDAVLAFKKMTNGSVDESSDYVAVQTAAQTKIETEKDALQHNDIYKDEISDSKVPTTHYVNQFHDGIKIEDNQRKKFNNFDLDSQVEFEKKDDASHDHKSEASLGAESVPGKVVPQNDEMEDDLNDIEEKKRRESVMKKLEEYENRKKLMQLQLEQMSQGLGKSDVLAKSSKPDDIIESDQSKPIEAPSHRQYVTAKDLVTDYDTGSKKAQTDINMEAITNPDLHAKYGQDVIIREREKTAYQDAKADELIATRPAEHVNGSQKQSKAAGTPKSSGFFVNLSDGSGKISTSTPKAKKQPVTETPPPEASPVKQLNWDQSTPKTIPKKALQKQIVTGHPGKEKKLTKAASKDEKTEVKEEHHDEKAIHEKGKENASKDASSFSRKGPVINGVRRTLVSPYQHLIQPQQDAEPKQIDNLNTKTTPKTGGDVVVKKPLETKNTEIKAPIKNVENAPNIKGPGPKIKTRDGSKVLVTELLKSREEIKNATANKQRYEPPEVEEKVAVQSNTKDVEFNESESRLQFNPVCLLEDSQAIRAVCFHPDGKLFAVGSNSKILRVCTVKSFQPVSLNDGEGIPPPSIVFKRNKYHKGSIYCMTWNPLGDIIATGSNDKSIKLLHFDPDNCVQESAETELNIHNGTVRELSFVPDKPAILISGGAGDGGVQITDCTTCQTIGTLRGHTGNVMAVYAGDGDIVATGSTDNTLRLWDLRSHRCIDVVLVGDSSPASVALSINGSYLASGQEDGCILLYDISAGRTLQSFRLHQEDCRSVRFSPDSKYLLTGSYDTDVSLLHTEGDLELNVPQHYTVAGHKDKVIQCRWHPNRYSFLSSSADRTAVVWSSSVNRNLLFS